MRRLTTLDKDMIIQSFHDADPGTKSKTIECLAKTLDVDEDTIKAVIRDDIARKEELKAKRQKKAREKAKEKAKETAAAEPVDDTKVYEPVRAVDNRIALPTELPEYIRDILFDKFKELEEELDTLEKRISDTKNKYKLLKKYLFDS